MSTLVVVGYDHPDKTDEVRLKLQKLSRAMNRKMSGCFLSNGGLPSQLLLINGLWLSLARAPRSGRGGRGFESHQPDFFV